MMTAFKTTVTITADDQEDALRYVDECGITAATIAPLPGEENGQRRFLVEVEFDAPDAMLARFQCAGIFAFAPEVAVLEAMHNVAPAPPHVRIRSLAVAPDGVVERVALALAADGQRHSDTLLLCGGTFLAREFGWNVVTIRKAGAHA